MPSCCEVTGDLVVAPQQSKQPSALVCVYTRVWNDVFQSWYVFMSATRHNSVVADRLGGLVVRHPLREWQARD